MGCRVSSNSHSQCSSMYPSQHRQYGDHTNTRTSNNASTHRKQLRHVHQRISLFALHEVGPHRQLKEMPLEPIVGNHKNWEPLVCCYCYWEPIFSICLKPAKKPDYAVTATWTLWTEKAPNLYHQNSFDMDFLALQISKSSRTCVAKVAVPNWMLQSCVVKVAYSSKRWKNSNAKFVERDGGCEEWGMGGEDGKAMATVWEGELYWHIGVISRSSGEGLKYLDRRKLRRFGRSLTFDNSW